MEDQISQFYEFLVDLEDEKLKEKNSKRRIVLMQQIKRVLEEKTNKRSVVGIDDDTGGYDKINDEEEEEEEEEYEESDDDDDDEYEDSSLGGSSADSHQVTSVTKKEENKRNSLWGRETGKTTDVSNSSFEGILYKKKKLNDKKYWAVVLGHHLLLSRQGYDGSSKNNKKTKSLKVNKDVDLRDYKVSITSQSGGKSEVKLVCPGKRTHLFYCKDKCEAEEWKKEIKKASRLEFASEDKIDIETVNEDTDIYIKGDVYEVISNNKKQPSNSNSHRYSNKSLDNYGTISLHADVATVSSDLVCASAAKVTTFQQQPQTQHGKAKKSKIQSLFNKVLNIRQKVVGDEDEDEVLISGPIILIINCQKTGNLMVAGDGKEQWAERLCVVKKKYFQAHRQHDGLDDILTMTFHECHVSVLPCSNWLVLSLKKEKKDFHLKFKTHSELTKWYQVLVDQIGKRGSQTEDVSAIPPEVLYEEIREVYHPDHPKANKRPALPDCPAPITPDINQVLMNINECSYMDAIECRGAFKASAMKEKSCPNASNQTPYVNSDDSFGHFLNTKNNYIESIYNSMSGGTTSVPITTPSYQNQLTTTQETPKEIRDEANETTSKHRKSNKPLDFDKSSENAEKQKNTHTNIGETTKADIQKHPETNKKTAIEGNTPQRDISPKTSTAFQKHTNEKIINSKNNNTNNNTISKSSDNNVNCRSAGKSNSEVNLKKSPGVDTSALINKFSGGFSTKITPTTTTTNTTATPSCKRSLKATTTTTTTATNTTTATATNTITTTRSTTSSTTTMSQNLSNSQTSLLRLQLNDSNNTGEKYFKAVNKRYSDTSVIKGNSIMDKIKIFENIHT